MSKAISYPYTIDGYGVVQTTENVNKIYLDRVLTLLSTRIGQRPILHEYGTNIEVALFENQNNLELAINQAITQAMARWIPEVGINKINITEPDQNGEALVELILELPNSTLTTLTVSTSNFAADGTITRQ